MSNTTSTFGSASSGHHKNRVQLNTEYLVTDSTQLPRFIGRPVTGLENGATIKFEQTSDQTTVRVVSGAEGGTMHATKQAVGGHVMRQDFSALGLSNDLEAPISAKTPLAAEMQTAAKPIGSPKGMADAIAGILRKDRADQIEAQEALVKHAIRTDYPKPPKGIFDRILGR